MIKSQDVSPRQQEASTTAEDPLLTPPCDAHGHDDRLSLESLQLDLDKRRLELEKLGYEVETARQGRAWWRRSLQETKVTEWVTAAAAVVALFAAWWTGWFNTARERLEVEKVQLERRKERLTAEMAVKEAELLQVKQRLLPFEEHEAALAELKRLQTAELARPVQVTERTHHLWVRFRTPPDLSGLELLLHPVTIGPQHPMSWGMWGNGPPPEPIHHPNCSRALAAATRLRSLNAVRTRHLALTSRDVVAVLEHPGVQGVSFRQAGLEASAIAVVKPVTSLTWLELPDNRVANLDSFPLMESVVAVNLDGNPLGDDGLTRLASAFPNLERLQLRGTRVSDGLSVHLTKLEKLTELDVRATQVTSRGLMSLATCPVLFTVDADSAQVTQQVQAAWKAKGRHVQFDRHKTPDPSPLHDGW